MAGIRYDGNKSRLYGTLKEYLPAEVSYYIDSFCGGLGMLECMLQDGYKFRSVHINDKNHFLHSLYGYMLTERTRQQLIDMVEKTVPFEVDFLEYKDDINQAIDDEVEPTMEDVYKWLYVRYFSFRTLMNNGLGNNHKRNLLETLEALLIHENIIVMNKDAIDFINSLQKAKDTDKAFVFLDPPYINTDTKLYSTREITVSYLENLVDAIIKKSDKFKIMFVHTRHPELESMLKRKGFQIHPFPENKNSWTSGQEFAAVNYSVDSIFNI